MTSTIPFEGKLLILGCGAVSRCVLPLLLKHVEMPANRMTVLDMEDCREAVAPALERGVVFVQEQIRRESFGQQFAKYVGEGDIIIDLTWNLQTVELLDWCHKHSVRYINASVELWDPYERIDVGPTTKLTLYDRHMAIRKLIAGWGNNRGPTAVLDHGANPGMVSHLTKMALIDIAKKLIAEKLGDARVPAIQDALDSRTFNRLAQLLNIKVIHISERDTQISNIPRQMNEFVNTWSVEGLFEEGIAPAEMGWGTHETKLPEGARIFHTGPRNEICLTRKGVNTWVRSWVPSGEIVGMVIRHGEAFSISDRLTVLGDDGNPVYRPTVHYAYCPCDAAIASLHELRMRNFSLQEKQRIMLDDIVSGRDELGCLLMGHDFKSWWIGSLLDIHETRRLVPGQNATTLQVAAPIVGALFWMIRNPHQGVNLPDDLPHDEVMEIVLPYLGEFVSRPVDWMPSGYRDVLAAHTADFPVGDEDPWQFDRFYIIQ
jgi:homospermidine synthase